ncbi:MAG TPA: glutamate-5-semialdehyde dehydrogenase [Candidatus Acidoferrum sp.]|nr:glutamate-5-semialdehyde dehydrogenase [Candidatus Acidoferrum sp.]
MFDINEMGKRARTAARQLAVAPCALRDGALETIARALIAGTAAIMAANEKDCEKAKENGIGPVMLDRLSLTPERIAGIAEATREIIALPDPVGVVESGVTRPNGLRVLKTKVPLGVVGMIYESRPNVTVDAAALCLKSGNACILRGGKEAINSNMAFAQLMQDAIESAGLPRDAVQLVTDTSHDSATAMMRAYGYIDVLIPRGSGRLIDAVVKSSIVPVIETGTGNCHVYVDESADLEMAADILYNAKTSRPSVCNAAESLLVHRAVAAKFLPMAKERLDMKNVELRGCPETLAILPGIKEATEEDYYTEYLDYILSVKVVSSAREAVDHITKYGTHHSEAIVTESYGAAEYFLQQVDAAAVYVNASTRFTDGGVFGMGAEMGISNQKLHTRGPIGLKELTTTKFQIYGSGQIR